MSDIQPIETIVVNSLSVSDDAVSRLDAVLSGWFTVLKLVESLAKCDMKIIHITEDVQNLNNLPSISYLDYEQLLFLNRFGLTEKQLIKFANGKHSLGSHLVGWGESRENHESSFQLVEGKYGANFHDVEFHHYMSWYLKQNDNACFDDFSIGAQMAKSGRFTHPSKDPSSILSTFSYGLNVDTCLFISLLKNIASSYEQLVKFFHVEEVVPQYEGDDVTQVMCSQGDDSLKFNCDFLIDCSGNEYISLGINEHLQNVTPKKFFVVEINNNLGCLTDKIKTHDFGWSKISYLKDKAVLECCFQGSSVNEVIKELNKYGIEVDIDKIHSKHYHQKFTIFPWRNNYLLLGQSVGQLEPLYNHFLTSVSNDIRRWIKLYPSKVKNTSLIEYYNHGFLNIHQSLHNYISCFYNAKNNEKSDFWKLQKTERNSESLTYLLSTFIATNNLPECEEDYFTLQQWYILLLGLGYVSKNEDPMIFNEPRISHQLNGLRGYIQNFVKKVPAYKDFTDFHGI